MILEIKLESRDVSEPDCTRVDYGINLYGVYFLISPSALPEAEYARLEVIRWISANLPIGTIVETPWGRIVS